MTIFIQHPMCNISTTNVGMTLNKHICSFIIFIGLPYPRFILLVLLSQQLFELGSNVVQRQMLISYGRQPRNRDVPVHPDARGAGGELSSLLLTFRTRLWLGTNVEPWMAFRALPGVKDLSNNSLAHALWCLSSDILCPIIFGIILFLWFISS